MDPTTLIVTALAAGTSTGAIEALQADVKDAAKTAYRRLRGLAGKRVAGRPDGELARERHKAAPQKWESVLAGELTGAGVTSDVGLVAARALMELVDRAGTRAGKYNVTISDSRGVQFGDANIQFNAI